MRRPHRQQQSHGQAQEVAADFGKTWPQVIAPGRKDGSQKRHQYAGDQKGGERPRGNGAEGLAVRAKPQLSDARHQWLLYPHLPEFSRGPSSSFHKSDLRRLSVFSTTYTGAPNCTKGEVGLISRFGSCLLVFVVPRGIHGAFLVRPPCPIPIPCIARESV